MNVKRFSARTSREALGLVRQAFGDDAVVMSTRPCAEGVEVLAMAPESVNQLERVAAADLVRATPRAVTADAVAVDAAAPSPATSAPRASARAERIEPTLESSTADDVQQLQMSTLSFQDYVRERMLKRRQSAITKNAAPSAQTAHAEGAQAAAQATAVASPIDEARTRLAARQALTVPAGTLREPPVLREEVRPAEAPREVPTDPADRSMREAARNDVQMLSELRSMRGLIEQRFGALAFMEKLQRQPRQAQLAQRLLDMGFSPVLTRKLTEGLPDDVAELDWTAGVLERNLATGERDGALEDLGGIHALIGATGVGKTTSAAKLAAAFAAKHGAGNLGLVTLDAYRIGAHEQLRTYGRILGVPVHTAHDRASLEDLLDLLAGKRMVLIDTAGMAQRDDRTRELLDMLSHPSIKRLVVVNAAAQGETIEDQLAAYASGGCRGVVLSKVDEAVKLGPALDAMIRARLKVLAVANGQRVPEDWHRLSAAALVQRALKAQGAPAWRLEREDVSLIFAGLPGAGAAVGARAA